MHSVNLLVIDRSPESAEHVNSLLRNSGIKIHVIHAESASGVKRSLDHDSPVLLLYADPEESEASIDEMVAKLAARLQEQPDDLKGWVMLARTYSILKRYSEAEAAYENVLRLGGENAGVLTDYADAMAMANGGMIRPAHC